MSTYTITTNFSAKDTLPASSEARVIKGSEFGVEFSSIQVAVNSNAQDIADLQAANTAVTASAAELNVLDGITASTEALNKLTTVTVSSAEINYLSGVTSNIQTQIDNISTDGLQSQITNLANRVTALEDIVWGGN